MNDNKSIRTAGPSHAGPRTRARAKAKITVQSSEAKPYDQTASPALLELHLSETFSGALPALNVCIGLGRVSTTVHFGHFSYGSQVAPQCSNAKIWVL